MDTLTTIDASRFVQLENIIENGLKTFVDVGSALLEIRDSRLYRQDYGTFEDYCRDRWGIKRQRAYELMDAAEVVSNLSEISDILPTRESHAAPLTSLPPQEQIRAWEQVVETAPTSGITAAHVQSVVDEYKLNREQIIEANRAGFAIDVPPTIPENNAQSFLNPALFTSETPEWYTPDLIVDRVRMVLGVIDIDPCSNSKENPRIPAREHYTKDDDGLSREWKGTVYMNPPYGREIGDWTGYLKEQYEQGNVTEAIALVPSRTDTEWFKELRRYPRCFIWGRLKFSESENSAPFPSMAVYLGEHLDAFAGAFRDIGDIYRIV